MTKANQAFKVGDRVKYQNVYGYCHIYLVYKVHFRGSNNYYDLTNPKKDGNMPQKRINPLNLIPHTDLIKQ